MEVHAVVNFAWGEDGESTDPCYAFTSYDDATTYAVHLDPETYKNGYDDYENRYGFLQFVVIDARIYGTPRGIKEGDDFFLVYSVGGDGNQTWYKSEGAFFDRSDAEFAQFKKQLGGAVGCLSSNLSKYIGEAKYSKGERQAQGAAAAERCRTTLEEVKGFQLLLIPENFAAIKQRFEELRRDEVVRNWCWSVDECNSADDVAIVPVHVLTKEETEKLFAERGLR